LNGRSRAWALRHVIAPAFDRLGGGRALGRVLEIGCGGGAGTLLLLERPGVRRLVALDLDIRMLLVARRRLSGRRVPLFVADAEALPVAAAAFDAVVDFGAVHLVPRWERALDEIRRVLAPGGRFFFEVVTSPILRIPYPLAMEDFGTMPAPRRGPFLAALERRGMGTGTDRIRLRFWPWSQLVGDLIGMGSVRS
jgi:SAM-dependent methyltransferase